jgi:hypothetical protein
VGASDRSRTKHACLVLAVLVFLTIATRRANADSGEYSGVVTLLGHGPQGANPCSLSTPLWDRDGTATLAVDVRGRVNGTLLTNGASVAVSGTLKVTRTSSKLTLRSSKAQAVAYHGFVSGHDVVGKLSDKHGLLGGTGTLTIDISNAAPLTARVFLALRNGTRTKRAGFASVTAAGKTFQLAASTKVGSSGSNVQTSGGGFAFTGAGRVAAAAFAFDSFSCTAFGVSIRGNGGTFGYLPNPPDVTLILSSGHPKSLFASDATTYLSEPGDAGPAIEDALARAGYRVESYAFLDYRTDTGNGPGYLSLVSMVQNARDFYVERRAFPTKVVVVDHSHGGVRAHQAIEAVPDLPVRLLVDLDASSCDFNVGHLFDLTPDPVDAWLVGGSYFDDEDVVQPNVEFNLEVRSNALCDYSLLEELFDDSYNVRTDGSAGGLFYNDAHTSHTEVHRPGPALSVAIDWMLQHL